MCAGRHLDNTPFVIRICGFYDKQFRYGIVSIQFRRYLSTLYPFKQTNLMDSVYKPKLKNRRRRVVDPENRKKAYFSCDRCKTRKLACKRQVNTPNTQEPCLKCVSAGVKCETTIQRKKKERGPIENIGLHYKCLFALVRGLRPEVDVNDIDSLIFLGESLGIPMPSRSGDASQYEKEEIEDISIKLSSKTKGGYQLSDEFDSLADIQSLVPLQQFTQPDSIIIDKDGTFHYVGPFGAAGFLDTCVNILVRRSKLNSSLWQNYQKLFECEIIISSNQDPMTSSEVGCFKDSMFPYVNLIPKKEMDYYFNVFFRSVHHRYFCFNETRVRNNYDTFWMLMALGEPNNSLLSNYQICCIYMIVILGIMYDTTKPNCVVEKYITVVRLCVSDMLLSPSLDGIQCLLLLSIYMDNNKRRDTGYCLIETAARQAITLGMNRKSVGLCIDDSELQQEMVFTCWTIFKHELVFSNQMGRSSCIQIEDIDIGYPTFQNQQFESYFCLSTDLAKLLYEVLEYRKKVKTELLLPGSIELTKELLVRFKAFYSDLPETFTSTENMNDFKLDLLLKHHYYILTFTLPYLLYVSFQDTKSYDFAVNDIIKEALESSLSMAHLFELSSTASLFNGTIFQDLFFVYHAAMTLVVGYIFLGKNPHIIWDQASVYDVTKGINVIKEINLRHFRQITGSSKKISKFMNILFNGLNILEFLVGDFVEGTENNEDIKVKLNFPIIHMDNVTNITLSRNFMASPKFKPLDEMGWFNLEYFKEFTERVTEIEENINDLTSI